MRNIMKRVGAADSIRRRLLKFLVTAGAAGGVAGAPRGLGAPPAGRGGSARVVGALLGAGGFVFGKANIHEPAFGITSNTGALGPGRNPYDTSKIPGGSGGGNAGGVGARFAPAGIGTDTGGSTRIPA